MPSSEMPGDLKMMNSVRFIVNCDICQQGTGICQHFLDKRLTCRSVVYVGCSGSSCNLVIKDLNIDINLSLFDISQVDINELTSRS